MPATERFTQAVEDAELLSYKAGLSAVPVAEGRNRISPQNTQQLLGSANMDEDCRTADPQGNRWDFVVGYERSGDVFAYFVEDHSATTGEVSTMEKKLRWLKQYLQRPTNVGLRGFPCEYHWVATSRIDIPKHTRQYKYLNTQLRKQGLQGPTKKLVLT